MMIPPMDAALPPRSVQHGPHLTLQRPQLASSSVCRRTVTVARHLRRGPALVTTRQHCEIPERRTCTAVLEVVPEQLAVGGRQHIARVSISVLRL